MKQHNIRATEGSSSLALVEITEHLKNLGYPKNSLQDFLSCGEFSTCFLKGKCLGCGAKHSVHLKRRCGKRFCDSCAKGRKIRIRKRINVYLRDHCNTRKQTFKFLTISPKNYENLEEGLEHLKKSFRKFLRRGYSFKKNEKGRKIIDKRVSDIINGGYMVLECTNNGNGWHLHLHCIIYSYYLENKYRGKCPHCGQTYLKKAKKSSKIYCANRSCAKEYTNLDLKKPYLATLFEQASGRPCFTDISHIQRKKSVINYCLKYIVTPKEKFQNTLQYAQFIYASYNKRLINPFGDFSTLPKIRQVTICKICDSIIRWEFDEETTSDYNYALLTGREKPPPPDLNSW